MTASNNNSTMAKPHVTLLRGPIIFAKGAFNNEATPAIGFAYIAGYLKKHGYQVEVLDAIGEGLNNVYDMPDYPGFMAQGLTLEKVLERIPAQTDVIGFSSMFSGEWPFLRDMIGAVRQHFPDALLVAGGEHATALPEYSLRDCAELDVIVKGEGEHTFLELLEAHVEDDGFEEVGGLCFIDNDDDEFIDTGGLPRIRDLDTIPWPYWPEGYLEKFWAAGKSHGVLTERDMPMLASRGCPYRCRFCSNSRMWTTRYVLRDADKVLDEIEHYIRVHGITSVQFYDLTAVTKQRWIVEFCTKMMERGININWSLPAGTRSEALTEETLALIQETGCHYLVYAPESGSKRTLEVINKRSGLEQITKSMGDAKKVGLVLRANLIIGFPHEKRADVYKTLAYGLKLAWMGVDEIPLFIFSAYPGTEIFDTLLEQESVVLGDDYYLGLTSLNSKFSSLNPSTYNRHVPSMELAFYRLSFMMLYYVVGYLRFPHRITRTVRNLFTDNEASTVLEHRLRDAFKRRYNVKKA